MKLLFIIDRGSTWLGHVFAWLIVVLAGLIAWEVGSRYVFEAPHAWAFDAQTMLYGTLFMLCGAYTLATSGHVRGDILYGYLRPRTQAAIDLTLYLVFFIPGVIALAWAGWSFAADSWAIDEHTNVTSDGPPIYPFKTVIPIAGAAILIQGLAEIARCVICLVRGEWPLREADVREVDAEEMKTMIHRDQIGEGDDAAAVRARET